ncbi:YbhB/YbcL family Raf kinase inhibitor-like protein [Ferruginibacter sp.]|nr:YbhB/YbcL family Raf kinase inhibitor-like protein [Ferruginibacter sp.]
MKYYAKEIDYKLLQVTSSSFIENELIPEKYTCDGENVNPPLHIEHIPEITKSLAIIVDDPDASGGTWVHWVVWNIPVTHLIKENEVHGIQGENDFKKHIYQGPCPPSNRLHRYFFKVYALDNTIHLPGTATKHNLERSMSGHILGFGELTGLYKRKN